jgi:hypothetical protein
VPTFWPSVLLVASLLQPASKLGKPVNDPVTAKGCLRGDTLRILSTDATDLNGVKEIRLKGTRSLMKQLADYRNHYVAVVGVLTTEGGDADRLEMRKKQKVGSRTTITVGAKGEQTRGEPLTPLTHRLELESFEVISDGCPVSGE